MGSFLLPGPITRYKQLRTGTNDHENKRKVSQLIIVLQMVPVMTLVLLWWLYVPSVLVSVE